MRKLKSYLVHVTYKRSGLRLFAPIAIAASSRKSAIEQVKATVPAISGMAKLTAIEVGKLHRNA